MCDEFNVIDNVIEEIEENNDIKSYGVNFHNITHDDMLNGEGLRVVLWLAGCSHKCKECHNPITWDCNGGIPFTEWEEAELWSWLEKPWTKGITFSGGDPLFTKNRDFVAYEMKKIRKTMPQKDITVYTGYTLGIDNLGFYLEDGDDVFRYDALEYVDILIDGKFETDIRKADIMAGKFVPWVGSSNQRVIDMNETRKHGCIVERIYSKDGTYRLKGDSI